MKQKFANAFSLALIVAMFFTSIGLADQITTDADLVLVNNQPSRNLGTVNGGSTVTAPVSFILECNGNKHVDNGQSVSLTFSLGSSTVPGGSLSATNTSIGPIPSAWPDDGSNCPSTSPTPIEDNGNSTVTITAPTSPGTYTYVVAYVRSVGSPDLTGDVKATFTLTVPPPADSTPPVITPSIGGTLGSNGWYTSDVTVSWSVVDNESSISLSSGCDPTTINVDTAGITLTCSATSAGGTNSQSVTIKRDATAPTISGSASPVANGAGWNNTDVAVSFTCGDNLSGVASCGPNQTLSSEGAGQSASGTAVDNAGNSASTSVSGINIDKTAPTASASASPAPNGNGWNNTDVTVSFSGNDGSGSGIASCSAAVVLSAEGAGQSASGTCTDKAGNVSASATASNINIDKTAPSVALVGGPANGGSYYFGSVPAAPTCNASDATSGLAGACSVSGYSAAVGTHTVTASASDNAGNSASASATYTVLAWTLNGFYNPVDMNGVYNTVKGGSTVPLKFEVFAGSTELTSTSVVASFVQTRVACDGSAPQDDIEITSTGGTSLRYDTTGGQFIQNWQTPRQPGICYRVTMTTQDGSFLQAFFKLK